MAAHLGPAPTEEPHAAAAAEAPGAQSMSFAADNYHDLTVNNLNKPPTKGENGKEKEKDEEKRKRCARLAYAGRRARRAGRAAATGRPAPRRRRRRQARRAPKFSAYGSSAAHEVARAPATDVRINLEQLALPPVGLTAVEIGKMLTVEAHAELSAAGAAARSAIAAGTTASGDSLGTVGRVIATTDKVSGLLEVLCEHGLFRRTGRTATAAERMAAMGSFAVPKGDLAQRLIGDCRRGNSAMPPGSPLSTVTLPSPEALSRMRTRAGRPVKRAGIDVSNFFHSCRLPAELDGVYFMVDENDMLYEAVTLPMGASVSPHLAQAVSLDIVRCAVAGLTNVVVVACDDDMDHVHVLDEHDVVIIVYLDDYALLGIDGARVDEMYMRILDELRTRGFTPAAHKCYKSADEPQNVLGIAVGDYAIGPPKYKAALLADELRTVASVGWASGATLASLVGTFVWYALTERSWLSSIDVLYGCIARLGGARSLTTGPLGAVACNELRRLAKALPKMATQLDVPVSRTVVASDASLTRMGACRTYTTRSRALGIANTASFNKDVPPPLGDALWRTTVSRSAPAALRKLGILDLELAALFAAVRHETEAGLCNVTLPVLVDNSAAVALVRRGRGRRRRHRAQIRRLALVARRANVRLAVSWVASSSNIADVPSRTPYPYMSPLRLDRK